MLDAIIFCLEKISLYTYKLTLIAANNIHYVLLLTLPLLTFLDEVSNRKNDVYVYKEISKSRPTVWELFKRFLRRHKRFNLAMALAELSDGANVSPITVRQYIYYALEAGWIEVELEKREGRRVKRVYRSNLYEGKA